MRAGVPRPLDELCDEVLHLQGASELSTARGIAASLTEFVGDPNGMQAALVASLPKLRPDELVVLPQVPEIPARDTSDLIPQVPSVPEPAPPAPPPPPPTPPPPKPEPLSQPKAERADQDAVATPVEGVPANPVAPEDLPTEAGMPIFDDDEDEVEWFKARSTPPPPPPPFEEPPERPLFAPEPEDGGPVRRSRVPPTDKPGGMPPHGPEYWPWESSTGRGTGSGLQAIKDEEVPGRSSFRLAIGIAAGLLLLVAVVVAFNLGRGKTVLGQEPEDDEPTSTSRTLRPSASAAPLTGLTAADLDPQGQPQEENPEDAPSAVDGDPATAWQTSEYNEQFGPGGLKTGVGLVVDLGDTREVSGVDLTFGGEPTGVSLYVTDEPPTAVADLSPVASETADTEELTVDLDRPVAGRYVVVWLTSLPAVDGRFRGSVAEVVVRGA